MILSDQKISFKLYEHNICTHGDRPPGCGGEAGANPKRLPALAARIKDVNADIVVLCESNGDFAASAAAKCGYKKVFNPKTGISELQILFKPSMFEEIKSEAHNIPGVRSHYLWVLLRPVGTDKRLLVYAYHGSLDKRTEELKEMSEISDRIGCPTIFVGDFNFSPEAIEYSAITAKYSDASVEAASSERGSTWRGWDTKGGGIIDYCFVTRGDFRVNSYRVTQQVSDGVILSDHCGILTEYTLMK